MMKNKIENILYVCMYNYNYVQYFYTSLKRIFILAKNMLNALRFPRIIKYNLVTTYR